MSASLDRPSITIPPNVWTELLVVPSSVTIQVGSPEQVWPLHSRDIDFVISAAPPTGSEAEKFKLSVDDAHLNRWGIPVTIGSNTPSAKLYAKPVGVGLGLVKVASWEGAAGALVAQPGAIIQRDRTVWVDGRIFLNPTVGPLTVPTPATRQAMTAIGFRDVTDGGRRYDLTTTTSVTATAAEYGIFAQSDAADLLIEFPADLPVGSQRLAARDGSMNVTVRFGDGSKETIDGASLISIDDDVYVYLLKETASSWKTVEKGKSDKEVYKAVPAGAVTVGSMYFVEDGDEVILPPAVSGDFVRLRPATDLLWSAWTGKFNVGTGITVHDGNLVSVDGKEIVLMMNSAGTSWMIGE